MAIQRRKCDVDHSLKDTLEQHSAAAPRNSGTRLGPARQLIDLLRGALTEATELGQVGPAAASDAGMDLLSILHFGIISQHLANDAGRDWDHGRFTRRHGEIIGLFVAAYPPGGG